MPTLQTMETKLTALRKACIKANPSILDLVFGCEFVDDEKKHLIFRAEVDNDMLETLAMTNYYGVDEIKVHHIGKEYVEGKKPEIAIPKIIGRPIRLADVLLAIADKSLDMVASPSFIRKGIAIICPAPDSKLRNKPEPTFCLWNLFKDDLQEQSPETIDFLYQLIKES